ncbi:MAG: isopentenyl phosphate kinase [Desulfurococcaceae archaeon TW002]
MSTVVKLGGSVITRKSEPLSARSDTISRLAEEISNFLHKNKKHSLVLVHGGGSFGHLLVRECLKKIGYINTQCFARVAFYMDLLNHLIIEALLASEIPAVRITPRSICWGVDYGRCDFSVVGKLMSSGIVPVLYGDVILSSSESKVLSGDDIVWYLTKSLGLKKVIFVTDVNGVYDKDPKHHKDARVLSNIHVSEVLKEASFWEVPDVTGGMLNKLRKSLSLDIRDVKIYVINGFVPGNLLNALEEKNVVGSILWV